MAPHGTHSRRGDARIEAAFREEQLNSWRLAVRVNACVFIVITTWTVIENGFPESFFILPFLVLLALLAALPYWLLQTGRFRPWHNFALPLLYSTLLTVVVLTPNPFDSTPMPPATYLRLANEVYFFCLLAGAMFTYSPAGVFWAGVAAALAWSVGHVIILSTPGVYWVSGADWATLSSEQKLQKLIDPNRVNLANWIRDVLALLATGGILAAFVWRARVLVYQQARTARERANLSRYFSPSMIDELAASDEPLGPTRSQTVAVLFADMIGFTAFAAEHTPAEVITLLRELHGRLERTVFAHEGTVDKYIGDAVMATFGTPQVRPDDGWRALACARAMAASVEEWNEQRRLRGDPTVCIGVGVHYGPVVLGDIGGEQRMEFAVLGDTVNIASRLERLTRELEATVVASRAVVDAATNVSTDALDRFRLEPAGKHQLRGRAGEIEVWRIRR